MRFRTLRDGEGRRIGAYQFAQDVTERLREQDACGLRRTRCANLRNSNRSAS